MLFYLISFESTHKAIKTEKVLKSEFSIEMIPTPREITASCGLSIKIKDAELKQVIDKMTSGFIDTEDIKIYKVKQIGDKKMVDQLEWR